MTKFGPKLPRSKQVTIHFTKVTFLTLIEVDRSGARNDGVVKPESIIV